MKKTILNDKELKEFLTTNFSTYFNGQINENTITLSNGESYKIEFENETILNNKPIKNHNFAR